MLLNVLSFYENSPLRIYVHKHLSIFVNLVLHTDKKIEKEKYRLNWSWGEIHRQWAFNKAPSSYQVLMQNTHLFFSWHKCALLYICTYLSSCDCLIALYRSNDYFFFLYSIFSVLTNDNHFHSVILLKSLALVHFFE